MVREVLQREDREYWRWEEYRWHADDTGGTDGALLTGGIDVGSVSTQAFVLRDGQPFAYASIRTSADSAAIAQQAMEWALEPAALSLEDVAYVVGTGYGRVNIPFAQRQITEISCHARGGNFIYGPTVRTILDMGGQDCKAIRCDERGKLEEFLMNDKCAAGTGRGMETMAELMKVPVVEMGPVSLNVDKDPPPVSSTCVVFAKSEVLGLLRTGYSREMALAAFCEAMAGRVVTLLERIGLEPEFAITGGIAKNPGIVKRIEQRLGITALAPPEGTDPQTAGALGAALFANSLALRAQKQSG
jgi:bzd-type benzoyl-CoA reductase Q subunit